MESHFHSSWERILYPHPGALAISSLRISEKTRSEVELTILELIESS